MSNLFIKNKNFYEKDGYIYNVNSDDAITSTKSIPLFYGDEMTKEIKFCDVGVLVEKHTIADVTFEFFYNNGERTISKTYPHYEEPMSILKEEGLLIIRNQYTDEGYNHISELIDYANTYCKYSKCPPAECNIDNDYLL